MLFRHNSKLILLISILLGLLIPNLANYFTWLLFPAVVIIGSLTLNKIKFYTVGKENLKKIIKYIVTNYVLLGGLLIIAALVFVKNPDYKLGLILLAISPPAIGIIPISEHLTKYPKDAATAEFLSYVIALIAIPIVLAIIVDINLFLLINLLLVMVIFPFVLSKIIGMTKPKFLKHDDAIINILYGIIVYIMIGTNYSAFTNFSSLWILILIFAILTFVLGAGFYVFLISRKVKEETDSIYILFSTMKNGGFSAVVAFTFFNPLVAVPIAVSKLLFPFYIWFLETLLRNHHIHYRNSKYGHLKH